MIRIIFKFDAIIFTTALIGKEYAGKANLFTS